MVAYLTILYTFLVINAGIKYIFQFHLTCWLFENRHLKSKWVRQTNAQLVN